MFQRTQNINLSPIKTMELLASKISDVVSLAQGIPSFDTPSIIKRAAIKALNRGVVAKYSLTYGLSELRETIEQKLAEDNMFYDFEKEIIVVAGSIEGITAALIAIIEQNKDEIIIFSPDYTSYAETIKVSGGKPVYVNLSEQNNWQIDFDELSAKISPRTAAIMFSNPNNPTGTIFSKDNLLRLAEIAASNNAFIISDEVYKDFVYSDTDYPKPNEPIGKALFSLAEISELRKRVIRIFSLSKAYAMAGWRIGFLHSDEENIQEILKTHDSLVTCAPVISQHAALAALDFAGKEIDMFRYEFQRRRGLTCKYLNELSDFFSYHKPIGSYFIFPRVLKYPQTKVDAKKYKNYLTPEQMESPSWQFALDLLYQARVAVVPGLAFGPAGENHIRLSFGRNKKDIDKAMGRIRKFLTSNF
jgi:aminotransferase